MKLTRKDIAELEVAAKNYVPKKLYWTESELIVLRQFFRRVPAAMLAEKIGRSINACKTRFLLEERAGRIQR